MIRFLFYFCSKTTCKHGYNFFFITWRGSKLPRQERWRGCQWHLQQSFTCEASVSRLSYFVTVSNYKGMSVHKLAHTVWRSINVCGKHTFASVFMGVIKALQRCKTCHPADLQQKISWEHLTHFCQHQAAMHPKTSPYLNLLYHIYFYAKRPMTDKALSSFIYLSLWYVQCSKTTKLM